jgi:hypothetical protein
MRQPQSQNGEELRRDLPAVDVFRIAGGTDRPSAISPCRHRQRAALPLEVDEVRIGSSPRFTERFGEPAQRHQPVRLRIGQWSEQHTIDHCEHDRRGADTEREDDQGNHGEAGEPAERAERIAYVLPEVLEPACAARVSNVFLDLLDSAEIESHAARGLGIVEARLLVRLDLPRNVKLQLFIDLAIQTLAVHRIRDSRPQRHVIPSGELG